MSELLLAFHAHDAEEAEQEIDRKQSHQERDNPTLPGGFVHDRTSGSFDYHNGDDDQGHKYRCDDDPRNAQLFLLGLPFFLQQSYHFQNTVQQTRYHPLGSSSHVIRRWLMRGRASMAAAFSEIAAPPLLPKQSSKAGQES